MVWNIPNTTWKKVIIRLKITNILIIIGEAEPVANGVSEKSCSEFYIITRGVSKGILEDLTEKFGQWRRCKRLLLLKRIWKWFLDQSNWKKEKKEKSFLRWWNCTKITWGSKILLHCFLSLPTVVKYLRSTSSNSNKCCRLPNMI